MKLGEAMYKAQAEAAQAQGAAGPGGGPETGGGPQTGPNGEKIVDAEFEEVDDKKKSA